MYPAFILQRFGLSCLSGLAVGNCWLDFLPELTRSLLMIPGAIDNPNRGLNKLGSLTKGPFKDTQARRNTHVCVCVQFSYICRHTCMYGCTVQYVCIYICIYNTPSYAARTNTFVLRPYILLYHICIYIYMHINTYIRYAHNPRSHAPTSVILTSK